MNLTALTDRPCSITYLRKITCLVDTFSPEKFFAVTPGRTPLSHHQKYSSTWPNPSIYSERPGSGVMDINFGTLKNNVDAVVKSYIYPALSGY